MKTEDLTEYADWLFSRAVSLCDNLADAQDISQEVLLAALCVLNKGEKISSPKTWLSQTLRHKYYDMLRDKYRRPVVYCGAPSDIPEIPCAADIPDEDEAENVRRELGYLAGIYREIMVRYYMRGEKAKDIAKSIKLSESAVKSRLYTARASMKKELDTMENYTAQSYEPEYLHLSASGRNGLNEEPFTLLEKGADIKMNLLILAYEKPLTVTELSKAIGIPAAYTEPMIDELVSGELMKRTGNKVYTDFMISTYKDHSVTLHAWHSFVDKNFESIWKNIAAALEKLHSKGFYKRQNERAQKKLELYFAVKTVQQAFIDIRDTVSGVTPWSEYPERPNGGKWFAMGIRTAKGFDPCETENMKYSISGEMRSELENHRGMKKVMIAEFNTMLGKTHGAYTKLFDSTCNLGEFTKLLYAVYSEAYNDFDMLNKHLVEHTDDLCEAGYFIKEDDTLKLDIPVLTSNEYWNELNNLVDEEAENIFSTYEKQIADIIRSGKIKTPLHIDSIPKFLPYLYTDSLIMMLLTEAKERSLFLADTEYKTPSTLFVIEE